MTTQGLPTATLWEGMSLTTTLPAPIVLPSPIVTPGRIVTLPPIQQLLPIVIGLAHSCLVLRSSGSVPFINPPFHCDYGKHIKVGKKFFANFNFVVLDEAPVTIGDDVFIGPNVSIYTACNVSSSASPRICFSFSFLAFKSVGLI